MQKIKDLELKIKEANTAYYNGAEIMSDDEYDALFYELSLLDPKNKLLLAIGADPVNEWTKEKHLFTLGSLNKINTTTEMSKWINENLSGKEVVVAEKLDGLSIGCQYDNGRLTKAILRGGGTEGENILVNVLKMHGVIKFISGFSGVLRGEIILTKTNHQTYFSDYANPRNAASGICRRLDGKGSEHLTVMFYQVLGQDFDTEVNQFKFLEQSGCLVPNYKLCKVDEVNKLWKDYQDSIRLSLDYEIDGLVVSCNDIVFQQSLGETASRPKGKLAFKFANQFIKTTVKGITWAVGNSGRVTPICWFDPVNLLGSLVSKASVYNVAYIKKLGLDVGAEVLICKAGEIIPRVEKVIKSTGSITAIPSHCNECNEKLIEVGEYLQCPNFNCRAQIVGRLTNWIKELNVLEWGTSLLEKLVDSNKVNTIADLYKLSVTDLSNLDRMGDKSAQKCFDSLWSAKEIPLEVFLGGLSIPTIGQSTIKSIMKAGCDDLTKFGQLGAAQFEQVPSVGPVKAQFLADGLKDNQQLILDLISSGIKIKEKVIGKLSAKSIAITGSTNTKRSILEKFISDNGGEYKSSINKSCTHLVIADINSTSSKAVAARKIGIKLISEDDLLNFIL